MNKSSFKKSLFVCGLFFVLAVVFTILVKTVGVEPVGPDGSNVGFANINLAVKNAIGSNESLYKITKYTGYLLFLPAAFFALLGLVQLIKRKSFKKVDREIKILGLVYLVTMALYLFFEKVFFVSYTPVLRDGVLKPSYPSFHVIYSIVFCGTAMLLTKKYLKLKHATLVNIALALLMIFNIVSRFLAGVHWLTDIMGGFFIGGFLFMCFYTALKAKPTEKPANQKE